MDKSHREGLMTETRVDRGKVEQNGGYKRRKNVLSQTCMERMLHNKRQANIRYSSVTMIIIIIIMMMVELW